MSAPTQNGIDDRDVRLKRLHKNCEVTLHRYIDVANDSCNMTAKLRVLPVSKDKRLELFLQRKKEDEAHDAYVKARTALLSALENDPEIVHAQEPASTRPHTFGTPRTGLTRRKAG